MSSLENAIRKHVLKNAYDYGKANAGSVVGKVIAEWPEAKSDMKNTMKLIAAEIAVVSKKSKDKIAEELQNYEFVEKKEEDKKFSVPGAIQGKVVTRFPPEPNGYPHIGHAKAAFINREVANTYGGKMLLRFDDTNPEKESLEYVGAIKAALNWLGIKWDAESYTSDNMQLIYSSAEKLISSGNAYVCTCTKDSISENRTSKKPCNCRNATSKQTMALWKKMLSDMPEGDGFLRFKGDMASDNTVMRDPALARIMLAKHYRQGNKYRVWPGYDLSVAVMDLHEGVTHPMRSKEYELRNELYYALCDALGGKRPALVEFSRLEIKNAPISKRLILPLVKEGKVSGWDDPRLPTIAGLQSRGVLPDAIKHFVLQFGISKTESEPNWDMLLTENRKLLDPVAPHYFFVPEPIKVAINLTGEVIFKLRSVEHHASIDSHIFLPQADYSALKKGDIVALKDLSFAKFNGKSLETLEQKEIPPKKIQWVSDKDAVKCDVQIPGNLLNDDGEYNPKSMSVAEGYCEKDCLALDAGSVVQFERFGFVKLQKKEKGKLVFVYSC